MVLRRTVSMLTTMFALTTSPVLVIAAAQTQPAIPIDNLSVHPTSVLSVLPADPWGINTAVLDGDLLDAKIPKLLRVAGVRSLRFPGGSEADAYHWQSNSITPGAGGYFTVFPGVNFDTFMGVAKATHAQPIITVNYGSNADGTGGGSPKEAAAWVQYANVTKKYGVRYWEIGNENYGNWEINLHKVNSAAQYGNDARAYIKDMKGVDPSIAIGVPLQNPGSSGSDPNWNATVLKRVGSKLDFVIIHWYPFYQQPVSDSQVLSSPTTIAQAVAGIRAQITAYCGQNAKHVQIMVTETNSNSATPTPQSTGMVNALFLADDFTTFLEQGVTNIDWWDLHNQGSPTTGDFGILQDTSEIPYPTFYALEMLNVFAKPGNRLVSTDSSSAEIRIHAVTKGNGDLSILMLNEDPQKTRTVHLTVPGFAAATTAVEYLYNAQHPYTVERRTVVMQHSQITQTLAPYTIAVLALR